MSVQISKFLSYVLRHNPQKIDLKLDKAGWVTVEELLAKANSHGENLTREILNQVVADCPKQRFAFSEDGTKIRANQGHSVEVDLGLKQSQPPAILYHGTVEKFIPSIRKSGLIKGQRHHVHLSVDETTATKVASRRGKPIILKIAASKMSLYGFAFFESENGVWLTDHVPTEYIEFPNADS